MGLLSLAVKLMRAKYKAKTPVKKVKNTKSMKANEALRKKNRTDAEVEAVVRDTMRSRADRAGSIGSGGGIKGGVVKPNAEKISRFDDVMKQPLINKAIQARNLERGSLGRYERNMKELLKAAGNAKRLGDKNALSGIKVKMKALKDKIKNAE